MSLNALFTLLSFLLIGNTSTTSALPDVTVTPVAIENTASVTPTYFQMKEMNQETSDWQTTELDSRYLVDAAVEKNSSLDDYFILLTFNTEGTKLLKEITARNISKPVGIFVDDKLLSAPVVNEEISGGKAQINGNFTLQTATQLANDLKSGSGM